MWAKSGWEVRTGATRQQGDEARDKSQYSTVSRRDVSTEVASNIRDSNIRERPWRGASHGRGGWAFVAAALFWLTAR